MRKTKWSAEEIAILRMRYPDERTVDLAQFLGRQVGHVYQAAVRYGVKKSEAYLASDLSARIQRGKQHPAMIATRFKSGVKPWNKGTHYVAGGRSAETRFKKGQMSGAAQHNYVPIGTLRIKDGVLSRKIGDEHPVPARHWKAVHAIVWEAANGPIPCGSIVVFLKGMKTLVEDEITVDKLELITRVENMRRNTYHNYPKEIATAIQLRGALNRKINKRLRQHEEQDGRPAQSPVRRA